MSPVLFCANSLLARGSFYLDKRWARTNETEHSQFANRALLAIVGDSPGRWWVIWAFVSDRSAPRYFYNNNIRKSIDAHARRWRWEQQLRICLRNVLFFRRVLRVAPHVSGDNTVWVSLPLNWGSWAALSLEYFAH